MEEVVWFANGHGHRTHGLLGNSEALQSFAAKMVGWR